jgi:hypothetical protein
MIGYFPKQRAKENGSEEPASGQRPVVKLKDLKDFNDRYIDDCHAFRLSEVLFGMEQERPLIT